MHLLALMPIRWGKGVRMSAKRDKYVKGRRTRLVDRGDLLRTQHMPPKTGVRKTRKQRDIRVTDGKRSVIKHPRA